MLNSMVCLVVTNNVVYYGRSVRMASKGIMFSNRVAGGRVRVRVTVEVGGPAKVHKVWVWRPEQSGLSGLAGFGVLFGGTVSASASEGCLRSGWPAEGKPWPAAAQSSLRASQALPGWAGPEIRPRTSRLLSLRQIEWK